MTTNAEKINYYYIEMQIKHGFEGQRLVVYPFYVMEGAMSNAMTADLVVHSMGFFPNASNHYIDRPLGCGEYILIYCTKGKGWFVLDGIKHDVTPNQFFILPAEKAHRYGSPNDDSWTIYWVHFKGNKAAEIYAKILNVCTLEVNDNSRMDDRRNLFDELLNVMEAQITDESVMYVNLCFSQLIASFLLPNIFSQAKYSEEKEGNTFFVSKATHFMNENIDKQIKIEELASLFACSPSYFYRKFVKETGYAPLSYFHSLKIRRASEMLANTQLKIKQVAIKLGIDDAYYFSRLFKNVTGISPSDYVKKHRKQ